MDSELPLFSALAEILWTVWPLAASLTKFAIYISAFLASGLLLFLLALPKADESLFATIRPLVLLAIIIAIIATCARVLVQAGRLMDDGWAGMMDPEIIAISFEGPLGQSTYSRLMGL